MNPQRYNNIQYPNQSSNQIQYPNQQYNQFVLYLSLSVPFLLISGPLLPDLVISIISLIFIVKLLKFKNYRLFFFTEKKIFFFIINLELSYIRNFGS